MNRIIAIATVFATVSSSAFAIDLPYTGVEGDPMGLTSSKSPAVLFEAAFETAAPAIHVEIPYTSAAGDPMGLTSSGVDLRIAREVAGAPRGTQIPYTTAAGDPDDLI